MSSVSRSKARDLKPNPVRIGSSAQLLLAEHQRWLRLVIFARLRDQCAVDEVLQNVALALVREERRGAVLENAPAWLYRVVLRQCMLYRRACGRARRLLDRYSDFQAQGADHESDPLSWLIDRERGLLIQDAIRRLPARDAELLLLKYAENWSAQALAAHLGLSIACVEARLHRARRRLREALGRADVIDVKSGCVPR